MLLVIDIGNTQTVLGVFEGERLLQEWRVSTDKTKTADEYAVLIRNVCSASGFSLGAFKAVAISCVVPPLLQTFEEFCKRSLQLDPLIIEPGIKTGIPILMDNPREVGADRIVNAVAAYRDVGQACIVVDFGTATTFDCVSAGGEYIGGAIVPGIGVSLEALFQSASKLPRVEIVRPKSVIGKNTIHCMQSGILFGYVSLVDGMVERIRSEMGGKACVIATGGLADRIATESQTIEKVDKYLTLRGLQILYELNRKEEF
jgi:type III pantothenate kinase